jgi:hypothetical protein
MGRRFIGIAITVFSVNRYFNLPLAFGAGSSARWQCVYAN